MAAVPTLAGVRALVDAGASELCLPSDIVESLNLVGVGRIRVQTADDERHSYRLVGMIEVDSQGHVCLVRAMELPEDSWVLLGAFPPKELDWRNSPREGRLIPNSAFPDGELTLYALEASAAR